MGPRPRARFARALLLAALLLQPRPGPAAAGDASSPEPPSFLSRHRRILLIATGAGAAATGIAAIASRHAANERYDEYQLAADPERIAALYDETAELDNRAAVLFVASEVLFVSALYLGFFVEPAPAALRADPASGAAPASRHRPWITPVPRGVALEWRF
jgi:hypothetical protein